MGENAGRPRWQRPALAGLAMAGILDTSYLLAAHLARKPLACPASATFDCDAVVTSIYSSLLGAPLSVWGLVAYVAVLVLALLPFAPAFLALRVLASALLGTGAFLLFLMLGVIHGLCLYCLLSAIVSAALFAVAQIDAGWRVFHPRPAMAGLMVAAVASIAIASPAAAPVSAERDDQGMVFIPLQFGGDFQVTTESGPVEMAFARFLAKTGTRMYGGFRCARCHRMKQLFGKQAWALIDYVECDPRAPDVRKDLCDAVPVTRLPTWVVQYRDESGEMVYDRFEGQLDLFELVDIARYRGSDDFRYRIQLETGEEVFDPELQGDPPAQPEIGINTE